jgi:hypothetical protein
MVLNRPPYYEQHEPIVTSRRLPGRRRLQAQREAAAYQTPTIRHQQKTSAAASNAQKQPDVGPGVQLLRGKASQAGFGFADGERMHGLRIYFENTGMAHDVVAAFA